NDWCRPTREKAFGSITTRRLTYLGMAILPLDESAMRLAAARQARLTKPAGSLGRLEDLAVRLAGITGRIDPPLQAAVVFTLAGDHGVAAEGVSAYPREAPAARSLHVLRGGAGTQRA